MGLIAADDMTDREQARLYEFTKDVTTLAFHTGYITNRWSPNDAALSRL